MAKAIITIEITDELEEACILEGIECMLDEADIRIEYTFEVEE